MNTTALRKARPGAAPAPAPALPAAAPRRRAAQVAGRALMYVFLAVLAVAILLPFGWMAISSVKADRDVFTVPIEWIPRSYHWANFADIWTQIPLATYLENSLLLSVVITFLQVLTGSFAAYGFAKMRFPGRDALFVGYIATIAVPWQAYMIPQYIMMDKLGLVNTRWSLILIQAFGAFGVFLMRQFYLTIPDEISEAARLDGLSEYGIWARIMLPLSKPALASLALLTFVNTWNDYMGPFIYLTDNNLWTVQIGLRTFVGQYDAQYAMIMAGSVISVLPVLVIFLLGQRYFVRGIATTGLKG
ncbi:carbohydrate ABC transporter permease [Streptomyces cocklensis]|uniref:Carbohydrate ABC transporter permease n=1 Tax=Actinacidiphila cocklensis TaxID=887465 RepID=A0A9W4DQU6_9ACTN|nr:carbohydrate ABC transporter permease [Actinacidiphila cocklensis]MDD1063405.1 carbohydrate ABC transporter permease [Actinacidiphila cocklensis]WSX74839.1 carbohydrate ABC transporter permease [Streptomyces sp. NBC_00899]CAG6395980.1 Carbohydrate ABC transporter permease [Actinacidiphila cocklensis]